MCRQVTCRACGKPTWSGCGQHIEQALRDVPTGQRCACGGTGGRPRSGTHPPAAADLRSSSSAGYQGLAASRRTPEREPEPERRRGLLDRLKDAWR
ncbi:hypothetical protein BJY21_001490 [Kineosphaera limosa]|uniref:Uncharacterized protein n=1 Tax=Kineosphaera limosa NBRC 100340 TaxID=1184609 RepID=K6WSS4_9MICO|nr:hypothetical protein [Kineosphaera limosa]NYE00306.1 hypothetical protein [Kineosphaera limosa]GAB96866.1 hypothetical protein KILIM_051_00070 [Kineosphaera limosa NBRC 100340]